MATLFDRTGFNFTDTSGAITTLPNTAIQQLNTAPALVPNQWMRDDLINDDTTGYYVNPVAPSCNTIWLSANTLINTTSSVTGSGNLTALWTTINNHVFDGKATLDGIPEPAAGLRGAKHFYKNREDFYEKYDAPQNVREFTAYLNARSTEQLGGDMVGGDAALALGVKQRQALLNDAFAGFQWDGHSGSISTQKPGKGTRRNSQSVTRTPTGIRHQLFDGLHPSTDPGILFDRLEQLL